MQGSRNIDILMHIRDYCAEINHTMDTFGRDYDIFVSNSIYQNAVALCVLQIGELTTHFTDEFKSAYNKVPWNQIKAPIPPEWRPMPGEPAWRPSHP